MILKTKKKDISRTKHKLKKTQKTQKPYKINVYAKNMRYMYTNETNPKNNNGNPIDSNKDKYKVLLSKLAEVLGENQWLKYSKDKYKPLQHSDKNKHYISDKPIGSYYSKGGWLFHEDMCCNLDWEIIFIEVDYKTISRITGKTLFTLPITNKVYKNNVEEFMTKYGVDYGKDKCMSLDDCWDYDTETECNETKSICQWDTNKYNKYSKKKGECIKNKNKIDSCSKIKSETKCKNNKTSKCYFSYKYKVIHWGKLYKNYDGFAIYPHPEIKMITNKKTRQNYNIFMGYDVETLVLWDHSPVIKYHNLGTIRDIIEETGVKLKKNNNNTHIENYYKEFIETLIKKINDINKKINDINKKN